MAYNDSLATNRDWVRFLIGDTTCTEKLSDQEIDALLVEEPNKYCAAAAALGYLLTKYAALGEGVLRKTVDELTVEYGGQGTPSPFDAIRLRISELRTRCGRVQNNAAGRKNYRFAAR